jgi:hypothetical protein
MKTIASPEKQEPGKDLPLPEGIQESIYPNHHDINITDGAEFLDDALRMKDQPLGESKTKKDQ